MLLCLLLSTLPRALDSSLPFLSHLLHHAAVSSLSREIFHAHSTPYPRFTIIITIILHLLIASARFRFGGEGCVERDGHFDF
jgi:hypothetical protein